MGLMLLLVELMMWDRSVVRDRAMATPSYRREPAPKVASTEDKFIRMGSRLHAVAFAFMRYYEVVRKLYRTNNVLGASWAPGG